MVTAPVPTDTWSRHSPQAGLVPGAGPSQLVHNHQEGLCHDGTVSVLGRWMQGAVLTVSRAEARCPGGPQVRTGSGFSSPVEHIHLRETPYSPTITLTCPLLTCPQVSLTLLLIRDWPLVPS